MTSLVGKTALVTGGSRGIGAAIVRLLFERGANVLFCARGGKRLQELSIALNTESLGNSAVGIVCDLENRNSRGELIAKISADDCEPDILINNVGGGGRWGSDDPLACQTEVWTDCLDKNFGCMRELCAAFVPNMVRRGWGRVITIGSIYGSAGGGRPWFQVSKAAQINFSKNLSLRPEFASQGVTFNCVSPGPVLIKGTGWYEEFKCQTNLYRQTVASIPRRQLLSPEEVAAVVGFLASPSASGVNGQNIVVDGGQLNSL